MEQKQNINNNALQPDAIGFFQSVLGMYIKESMDGPKELRIVYDGIIYGLTSAFTVLINPEKLPHDADTLITVLGALTTRKESGQNLRKVGVETMDSIAEKIAKEMGTTLKDVMNMSPDELRTRFNL